MRRSTTYIALLAAALFLAACHKDLRTPSVKQSTSLESLEAKGKALLQEAYKAHGMEDLKQYDGYEMDARFKFHAPFRTMNMDPFKVGPKDEVKLRYAVNSFDGQMEYMNGKRKGQVYGAQSFVNYKKLPGEKVKYYKRARQRNAWGTTAYHYLTEIPMRIQKANIVRYAGTENYNGVEYDLVFATWNVEKPNKDNDHWVLYIHPETKRIDLLKTTIKEYYMPIPGIMYATVLFQDYQKRTGDLILPSRLVFQMFNPKEKDSKFIYDIKLSNYQFDSFPIEDLYPNKSLEKLGDTKTAAL